METSSVSDGNRARGQVYAGLFLVTLSTLMYEIVLTRIFSLTMLYHFAFMAISTAMFGMTLGATVVFLFPRAFSAQTVNRQLALYSLLFGPSMIASFLLYLSIPFGALLPSAGPLPGKTIFFLFLIYTIISAPFIFSGICTCLALTRFPLNTARLYAADLIGAALGCIALVAVSSLVSGPVAVYVIAFVASISAISFSWPTGRPGIKLASLASSLAVFLLLCISPLPSGGLPRLSPLDSGRTLWESWNSHSRVRVDGNPHDSLPPSAYFLSPKFPALPITHQLLVFIDTVPTIMTGYKNDPADVEYLKFDISNFAHHLRPDSRVLVIGVGGGRDILSALTFNQKSVVGVEVNANVLKALNQVFGDFSGHLDRDPRVTFVHDDGRSYVARSKERFDIIQISFVDTFAATGGGAFVLCENSLYTTDAFKAFMQHLSPDGILSLNRWYFQDRPGEMLRATSLACAALRELGVGSPRDHILIVRNMLKTNSINWPDGFGTILISPKGFSAEDVARVKYLSHQLGFEVVMTPKECLDPDFIQVASKDPRNFLESYPINISPTTDDSPFFFQMLRLKDFLNWSKFNQGAMSCNMQAVGVLGSLIVIVVVLNLVFVIVPLLLSTDKRTLVGWLPITVFFMSIGLGFMSIEIALMQRLIIFLGHPTYSLSVVLFTLLLATGVGSLVYDLLLKRTERLAPIWCLAWLLVSIVATGLFAIPQLGNFAAGSTGERIMLVVSILSVLGIPLGCCFPLGMRLAQRRHQALAPWLWGVNGAASVTASVLATAIALTINISTAYWIGALLYVIAAISYFLAARSPEA